MSFISVSNWLSSNHQFKLKTPKGISVPWSMHWTRGCPLSDTISTPGTKFFIVIIENYYNNRQMSEGCQVYHVCDPTHPQHTRTQIPLRVPCLHDIHDISFRLNVLLSRNFYVDWAMLVWTTLGFKLFKFLSCRVLARNKFTLNYWYFYF